MKLNLLAIASAVLVCATGCSSNHGETKDYRGSSGGQASPAASTDQSTTPKGPDTTASREIGNRTTGNGGTRYDGPGPEMADPNGTTKAGSGPPKTR